MTPFDQRQMVTVTTTQQPATHKRHRLKTTTHINFHTKLSFLSYLQTRILLILAPACSSQGILAIWKKKNPEDHLKTLSTVIKSN